MNFIGRETTQKLRGGYYTPPDVAAFLSNWIATFSPRRVLEPACGDGVFFDALAKACPNRPLAVMGCEINEVEAAQARARTAGFRQLTVEVHNGDFLDWYLKRSGPSPGFDAVLGNPPFVRYQYLDQGQQARAEEVFRRLGLPFTRHTNAWVPFVVASLALLRAGGRLAMVVPAELLHVLHAQALRQFLLRQCTHVLVIDPADMWFDDALQGVVLLLVEKRAQPSPRLADVGIVSVSNREALTEGAAALFHRATFVAAATLDNKWMPGLLSRTERALLERLRANPSVHAFGEVASVDVGIVTGANQFFLVPDAVVHRYALEPWAYPMFGRSEHVRGVIYDHGSHQENRELGLPTNFLWFADQPAAELPRLARRYLREGEGQGLHRRYKCRIRTPWYRVPSVYVAPVAMLKRCHHYPRLVLNRARALTTDTAYRIVPRRVTAANLVLSFVNSLTALSSELEGRHYGGGVLELVPSEIERVLLPTATAAPSALDKMHRAIRQGVKAEELLARQDQLLLLPLGIGKRDADQLLAAWQRLRARRQRQSR